jgi:hypothetical protein
VNEASVDGSLWMYLLDDVKPLIGWGPLTLASFREKYANRDWENRQRVLANIARIGEDRHVNELVRGYNAKWIFFDERHSLLTHHVLQLDALRQNPWISEVFRRGPVHVFGINTF